MSEVRARRLLKRRSKAGQRVRSWPIGEVETRLAEVRLAGVQRPDFAPVEFFAF
jgi:hypothetical protein